MIAVAMLMVAEHQHRPHHVRQHVRQHDGERPPADDARRLHVLLLALDHGRAAHRARVVHPAGEADGEDQHRDGDVVVALGRQRDARHAVDEQRDQDRREGKLHVGHAHDQRVQPAAEVAGQQSQRYAEDQREKNRGQPDAERDARAVHDGRQDVAALVVGAEEVRALAALDPGRRLERRVQVKRGGVERVLRGEPGREQRRADTDQRQRGRDHGDRRPAEAPGEVVVPESPEESTACPSTRAKRDSGRSSALCTVVTLFFIAHGRSWWWSGT